MKKFFLLPLFALFVGSFQLAAQSGCEPDVMLPDTVIVSPLPYQMDFPERGIQDTACIGGFFETNIQVQVPPTFEFSGTEINVDSIVVNENGIDNLPAAFDYICNPPSCVFLPEEIGCIQVFGEAVAGDAGMYDLKIDVQIYTAFTDFNFNLPDGVLVPGNYFFFVREEGSENCLVDAIEVNENAFDLRIQPNPFSDYSDINVELPTGGEYDFQVFNALGTMVQNRKMNLNSGLNSFRFDGTELATGMYIFRLQQGNQAASGRLLIQR